ncbi:DNA phosphorothioation-associated DGQHR protein 1 [Methylocaldum gracile]|jgi:DNA phosphorothioation-associated DGQHR protein 1
MSSPLVCPAIRVKQPLGEFYAFSLSAQTLNKITYSQPASFRSQMEREASEHKGYSIFGTQRQESRKRLDEIAAFIQTSEATFPNAIILAANYDEDGKYVNDENQRWHIELDNGHCLLHIPALDRPSASIIDGQHRLHAFQILSDDALHRDMELLCVVYLELPTPFHAYIFATINFNQKKVDRSLAYELFGFDLDERPPEMWPPETLAVYLARVLNTDKSSPLYRCITPVADSSEIFGKDLDNSMPQVRVSMASIVDGILSLISGNPKEDRYRVRHRDNKDFGRSCLQPSGSHPLRDWYIKGNDRGIYEVITNYFSAVSGTVWRTVEKDSYLLKTVGVQALFDVLRILLTRLPLTRSTFSKENLKERLRSCEHLGSKEVAYQASGIGRSAIRDDILKLIDFS